MAAFEVFTEATEPRAFPTDSMPAKALWLLQIPEIVALLETFDVPVVDRSIIERLFGLRRRRAIELLHRFGGYQAGRTFLIDRRLLIEHLRRLADGEEFQRESRRKERLDHTVDQLRRHQTAARVKISVQPDVFSRKLAEPVARGGPGSGSPAHRVFRYGRSAEQTLRTFPGREQRFRSASARRQNRPNRAVHKAALHRHLLDVGRSRVAEQGGIDQRVELRQRFGAQFLGIELQGLGDAWNFGKFHAPAAAFPLPDTFRANVECLGDLRLQQREFFAAPAQQDVQAAPR